MRTIGVVTVGRSDYGIYRPVLRAIQQAEGLALRLFVTGTHLEPSFGLTVRAIEVDGFPIAERIPMGLGDDSPAGIAAAMGRGTLGFSQAYGRCRPDVLVLLGDRFEMHAAAVAAVPFAIPLAHLHGGELTNGAIDNAWRHAMTKMSHLHFVATEEARRRVLQMGEEPWRVVVSGAPGLDNLRTVKLLTLEEIAFSLGKPLKTAPLLVTYHPVTLEYEQAVWQIGELLAVLEVVDRPVVFTAANADTNGRVIRRAIEAFVASRPSSVVVDALGTQAYFSLMAHAAAMIGNSSSGLIEAPSFKLPVVNIGTRQAGRLRAENVIDVGYGREAILQGIRRALAPETRECLKNMVNPYGEGRAADVMVDHLRGVVLDHRFIAKSFVDWPSEALVTP
ncbi:MAG: UDP-N-acetylglucosamine 2-epimerase (hydrolyzing) [Candidatus Omnitrophica bacterium]|nr:UDP-N-acetylglucosamine 2-epimerase (hydrolyzing) [Candidatus Omnitrophota bacterium]